MKSRNFLALLFVSFACFAFIPPPPGDEDPVAAPIDDMLYILLIAGILLGIYIIKKAIKKPGIPKL